jgi:hypothetical protein
MRSPQIPFIPVTLALFFAVEPAWAHAFGVRYDLPLPLWLYLGGAGGAVALSFVVMAVFLKDHGDGMESVGFNLLSLPVLGWLGGPVVLNFLRLLSLSVVALLLASGFWGNPDPFKNITPTFIWVVWWVGMAFVSALVGNVWDLINPWKIIFNGLVALRGKPNGGWAYPARLGYWPAVVLFWLFAWMELISENAEQPRMLALLIVVYSAVTWTGMRMFGGDAWLRRGEIFTVMFGLLARFAFTNGGKGVWRIRLPAAGLLRQSPVPLSGVCFVLLLLTSVTFDGILETPLWSAMLAWVSESQALRPALIFLRDGGADLIVVIKSAVLLIIPAVSVAVFMATSKAIAWVGGGVGTREAAGYFVLSLIPIAIAYHLSHYLSYLMISGQNIIPMLSDPFGVGWDLFGTKSYRVDIGVVNAKMIWYVAVTAIVVGHVLAVYIAHVMAIRVFGDRVRALRSQIPMLILMVGYTMVSLWILSQPIVA